MTEAYPLHWPEGWRRIEITSAWEAAQQELQEQSHQ